MGCKRVGNSKGGRKYPDGIIEVVEIISGVGFFSEYTHRGFLEVGLVHVAQNRALLSMWISKIEELTCARATQSAYAALSIQ